MVARWFSSWAAVGICAALIALASSPGTAAPAAELPGWLAAHVGEGDGQIAGPVLRRARELYLDKVAAGAVKNPCYFAMDATLPNDPARGRFYIVCEANQTFAAISAGHGAGRDLPGLADFSNGRTCARHFGNAMDSELTTGGAYLTGAARTSFKGYYRASGQGAAVFMRTFIPFLGQGDTANAWDRQIGGHAAVVLKGVCLRKEPGSPYANQQGYVPFGTLVDYPGGRSNGCTSWSRSDAAQIADLVKDRPTTLYIYPEQADIRAVARAVDTHQGARPYWNADCLKAIGAPKFWSKATLEPLIARFKAAHPAPPPRPTPICTGQ